MTNLPWIIAGLFGVLLAVQAVVMRLSQRRAIAELQARHDQIQRDAAAKHEAGKRRISQLLNELHAARVALQEAVDAAKGVPVRPDPAALRQAMERELVAGDAASDADTSGDGFADTEVSMHDADDGVLLIQ